MWKSGAEDRSGTPAGAAPGYALGMDGKRLVLVMRTDSYRASAFLAACARLGVAVTVASDREQALAAAAPERGLVVRLERPAEAAGAIADFAASHPVQAVLATDDDGAIAAALACERLGLRHHCAEGVRTARDKARTRRALADAAPPGPRCEVTAA